MYAQVEKPKENTSPAVRQESRAVADSVAQKKSNGKQAFGFVDNRPEVVAQRKLQEVSNNFAQLQRYVIQRGNDPIDESVGQKFKYGLIKGTYVPNKNEADMHVEPKSKEAGFSGKDVYGAFSFVYKNMVKQKKKSGIEGSLIWNPQGAAVIKMVAELIGESLGDPELVEIARLQKENRKSQQQEDVTRDPNIMSQDIIPEHLQYLTAARGVTGVTMKPVIPGNMTEDNYDSDLLEDNEKGRSRFTDYSTALENEIPISLRITISQAQLGTLIETMKD